VRDGRIGEGARARALRPAAVAALAAALLAPAPAGRAARAASLTIVVNFSASGVVTVTLPDGTPVGTTSGPPTVIPAGFYTLVLNGPGECINLPLWELRGPGVNVNDDMLGGETDTHALYVNLLPNTTYTWHLDRNQSVVYTFRTSSEVLGTPPAGGTPPTPPSSSSAKPASQDIVGSAILPFRGTLSGAVTAAGRITLAYRGRSVTHLAPGRYRVAVVDRSSTDGFLLGKPKRKPVGVTAPAFVGRRSASVTLTAGTWLVLPRAGRTAYTIAVG